MCCFGIFIFCCVFCFPGISAVGGLVPSSGAHCQHWWYMLAGQNQHRAWGGGRKVPGASITITTTITWTHTAFQAPHKGVCGHLLSQFSQQVPSSYNCFPSQMRHGGSERSSTCPNIMESVSDRCGFHAQSMSLRTAGS